MAQQHSREPHRRRLRRHDDQAEKAEKAAVRQLPRALHPFRSPDYRILAGSMVASLFGAGMWAVAMVYEVLALGGGPLALSAVGTATSIGLLATALLGGVAADLLPKRAILRTVEGLNFVAVGSSALLSSLGLIEVWHLAATGALLGVAAGFFFPAYSAILPRILPADALLAANGLEGAGRPALQYAAGPATAGALVASFSPGDAITWIAVCHFVAFVTLWWLHPRVDERVTFATARGDAGAGEGAGTGPNAGAGAGAEPRADAGADTGPGGAARTPENTPANTPANIAVGDGTRGDGTAGSRTQPVEVRRRVSRGVREIAGSMRDGVRYTVRTPWLRWTLLWAVIMVFLFVGPFEVLTPFVLRDLGLGADAFGLILAANGVGSIAGALAMSSRPMPRRYLTWMMLAWGASCLPLSVFGYATDLWMLVVAGVVMGVGGAIGQVIWGTLLQRRVPTEMLGRVSSLDFFVSLAFMPLSMALVGPIALVVDVAIIFLAVGLAIPVFTIVVWLACGFRADEIEHPLGGGDHAAGVSEPASPEER